MLKAALFDFDNTLYDYDSAHNVALHDLHAEFRHDRDIGFEEFISIYNDSKSEVKRKLVGTAASHERILYMQELSERTHGSVTPSRILTLYHTYWDSLIANSKLFEGALENLKYLREKGIKIVLVTNLTAYVQIRRIEEIGISDYIDSLVTSQEAGYEKPHPASFLLGLHKANSLPENAVMIGDSLASDIEGANALGIRSILYKFGKQKEDKTVIPTYIVNSHLELLPLLKSLSE